MNDNALIQLFLPIITANLSTDGFGGVIVQASSQPTQQGVPTGAAVYFQKIHDHRYGWGHSYPKWNDTLQQEILYEDQWHETTFQVSALVIQKPQNTSLFTAADLANEVASILQSQSTQVTLMASNVGLLRISDITNPYFTDDRDQFEAMPSFDFTLTNLQTRVSTIPVVSSFEVNLHRE